MESLPQEVAVVEDINGVLQVRSDGTIFRTNDINFNIPILEDPSVIWEDCQFEEKNNLYLRVYKPVKSSCTTTSGSNKLPILFFIHGGGFCVASRTWPNNHNACLRLASGLQAVVVAPDYRLATERRLPAALDDVLISLKWLQIQALSDSSSDPKTWLRRDEVDFGQVCIIGDSSGGNIAHHLAVLLGPGSPDLDPVRVRCYVLMAPFFGGMVRTNSEAEGTPEPLLNWELLDRFWRLSLPIGHNRDHPLANPLGPYAMNLEAVMMDPLLVIVGGNDLLRDRVDSYARRLKEAGKKVGYAEFEGEFHGLFSNDPYSESGNRVLLQIKNLLSEICSVSVN